MADTSLLARLFQDKKYNSCADAARGLLVQPDLTPAEKATCYTYLCRSQYQLRQYGACIESGIRAAYLAEEVGDACSCMVALLNVGGAQFHMGMLEEAVESYRHCLRAKDKSVPSTDKAEGHALRSLGETLRALGRYEEATLALERARIWWQGVDAEEAERTRRYIVWTYLEMGNPKAAERLLPLGDQYVVHHPGDQYAAVSHLIDKARYNLLTGDLPEAVALAWECLGGSKEYPVLQHCAYMVIADAMEGLKHFEAALAFAYLAEFAADWAERPDLFANAKGMVDRLRMQQPEAARKIIQAYIRQRGSA